MRIVGVTHLSLTAQDAWARLSDLERLGEALPAVQAVNVDGEDCFSAAFRAQTGLGATPIRMTFTVVEREAPGRLRVQGTGGAAEYAVEVDASFELVDDGDGAQVHWSADVRIHGVLRSLTQRALPSLVRHQVEAVLHAAVSLQAA